MMGMVPLVASPPCESEAGKRENERRDEAVDLCGCHRVRPQSVRRALTFKMVAPANQHSPISHPYGDLGTVAP